MEDKKGFYVEVQYIQVDIFSDQTKMYLLYNPEVGGLYNFTYGSLNPELENVFGTEENLLNIFKEELALIQRATRNIPDYLLC